MEETRVTTDTKFKDIRRDVGARMGRLSEEQPDLMKAFRDLHHAAAKAGALDVKTKELIALGIAVGARCDDCIAFHTHDAMKAGATRAEILETLGVAILMGGGPSMMYATHVLEAMSQFGGE
ncbi:MAG: carboxymuconolactone decarboxylase family protein [Planctomycetes bacterium]|nr:carboxymuconolactone decarboxylase family protein [Planctomycetota bacterium]